MAAIQVFLHSVQAHPRSFAIGELSRLLSVTFRPRVRNPGSYLREKNREPAIFGEPEVYPSGEFTFWLAKVACARVDWVVSGMGVDLGATPSIFASQFVGLADRGGVKPSNVPPSTEAIDQPGFSIQLDLMHQINLSKWNPPKAYFYKRKHLKQNRETRRRSGPSHFGCQLRVIYHPHPKKLTLRGLAQLTWLSS